MRSIFYYVYIIWVLSYFLSEILLTTCFQDFILGELSSWGKLVFMVICMTLMCGFLALEHILYKRLRTLYDNTQNLCNKVSDAIDWTTMRKRQAYKNLEPELQEPINSFFSYCLSPFCPFYGGRRIRHILLFSLFIIAIVLWGCLFYVGIPNWQQL